MLVCAGAVGCGKKGPPLAPLVPIPAAVAAISANRVGHEVYVTLTIPAENIDEHAPANLGRVEIYGYTGRVAPPRSRWVELGTLVATVPVAPPAAPEGEKPKADDKPSAPKDAPLQGAAVTIRDALTPEELVQGKLPPPDPALKHRRPATTSAARNDGNGVTGPGAPESEAESTPLRRFYTAVPFSVRGRPGPPGQVAEIALAPAPPDAPPSLGVTYTDAGIALQWQPSGGLMGFLLERPVPDEPPPVFEDDDGRDVPASEAPSGPVLYNVYREAVPDVMAPPQAATTNWNPQPPSPINPVPLQALEFTDPVEFGQRRCYTVRAVRGVGPGARTGDPSPVACVTPIDTFPPLAPKALAAVASEGAISLIWEPNTEPDLGGYIVLRGEAGDDTLHPLTTAPIMAARYRDEQVKPGARYVYAVVAVDNRFPLPNMSLESNRVEETAR